MRACVTTRGSASKLAFDPLGKGKRRGGRKAAARDASKAGGTSASAEASDPDGTSLLLDKLAEQFSGAENDGQLQSIVNNVMQQLMSKEVLYEPLKEIAAKYPQWLADNESKLTAADAQRYRDQHAHIERLCKVYESSSGGAQEYEEVVALMQQVQSCGQPPEDIIRELAPDLEVGPDGLPTHRGRDPLSVASGGLDPSKCAMQ